MVYVYFTYGHGNLECLNQRNGLVNDQPLPTQEKTSIHKQKTKT